MEIFLFIIAGGKDYINLSFKFQTICNGSTQTKTIQDCTVRSQHS